MSDCPRLGHMTSGCKFEPRYDHGQSVPINVGGSVDASGMAIIMEASKSRRYVRDICVTCGKTVEIRQ